MSFPVATLFESIHAFCSRERNQTLSQADPRLGCSPIDLRGLDIVSTPIFFPAIAR